MNEKPRQPAEPDPNQPGQTALELINTGAEWLKGAGRASDVVVSSRVRLARNLAGFPFMPRASRVDRQQIVDLCHHKLMEAELAERLLWIDLREVSRLDRNLLVERHLISQAHARGKIGNHSVAGGRSGEDEPRAVAVGLPGERLSIMVNEEDHLRIQAVKSGFALAEALTEIDTIDDRIEAIVDYAFHPRFGYLTACPTNVGTGIRFGVMLHLPALKLTGDIEKVTRAANDMSLAVRGFYGEGSEPLGDFFQISNQTTLGKSERVLLHDLEHEIIPKVIEYERVSRKQLVERRGEAIADQVHRALGVLTHARLLATDEATRLLSQLRLGVAMGLIEKLDQQVVHNLMLLVQPAHLQRASGRNMTQAERRIARADLVRSRLQEAMTRRA